METIHTFSDIINKWPTAAEFGRDLGVSDGLARAMKRRDSISSKYWNLLIEGAHKRKIRGISYQQLAAIASNKRERQCR